MLGIMAGLDQKDTGALIVDSGSDMCWVGFTGYGAPRVMFPSGVAKPKCSASWLVWTRLTVTTWCPWSRLQKTADYPQLQSVAQRQFPMVQTSQLTTEVPQLPFVFGSSMPLLCRSCLPYLLLSTTGAQGSDSAEHRRGPAVAVHQFRRFPVVMHPLPRGFRLDRVAAPI